MSAGRDGHIAKYKYAVAKCLFIVLYIRILPPMYIRPTYLWAVWKTR